TIEPRTTRTWDFGGDIVPILTRLGCNTGACHGRLEGQNGFHLLLFGYDPASDYQAGARGGRPRPPAKPSPPGGPLPGQGDRPGPARWRGPDAGRLCGPPDPPGLGPRRGARASREDPWGCGRRPRRAARCCPDGRTWYSADARGGPVCRRPPARRDSPG